MRGFESGIEGMCLGHEVSLSVAVLWRVLWRRSPRNSLSDGHVVLSLE
jgi:hypothetical protein